MCGPHAHSQNALFHKKTSIMLNFAKKGSPREAHFGSGALQKGSQKSDEKRSRKMTSKKHASEPTGLQKGVPFSRKSNIKQGSKIVVLKRIPMLFQQKKSRVFRPPRTRHFSSAPVFGTSFMLNSVKKWKKRVPGGRPWRVRNGPKTESEIDARFQDFPEGAQEAKSLFYARILIRFQKVLGPFLT